MELIERAMSNFHVINYGVLLGSVLGLLPFLTYINDVINHTCNLMIKLFVLHVIEIAVKRSYKSRSWFYY